MSIPASRIALVTEDRATRAARKAWQGNASPAAMEMAALHVRKTQLGFAIVTVAFASLMTFAACIAPAVMGVI